MASSTAKLQPALLSDRFNTLRYEDGAVVILDRRKYPFTAEYIRCTTVEEVARAIEDMIVQGGPPLAYVAGLGLALGARQLADRSEPTQRASLAQIAERLRRTRPTADDLGHILAQAVERGAAALDEDHSAFEAILAYVNGEIERGNRVARECGRRAAELLEDGDRLLTHCFAGAALNYMLYYARLAGKNIHLFPTETRPYLQGARLTASQAVEMGIPVTLLTDNMPAHVMAQGMVNKYVTAADRVTLDGHIANKVGTYQYAICARYHGLPFYVLGYDGPDPNSPSTENIVIEERNPSELFSIAGVRTAVDGIGGYYPAFDITPPELITAIVTDRGIFSPAEIARYFDSTDTRGLLE